MQAGGVAQIHELLDGRDKLLILIDRVVTQDVHVESGVLADHRFADSAGADDGTGLPRNLITQKGQEWVPESPPIFAHQLFAVPKTPRERAHHEEGELGGGVGEDVGGVGERNLVAIGIGAIDVVKAHGELSDDFERALSRLKDFSVDGITQRSDQAIDAAADSLYNQLLRRSFRTRIDFEIVSLFAKAIFRRIADVSAGEDAGSLGGHRQKPSAADERG